MELGRYSAVLVSTWWYLVSMVQYWLVLSDTGSAWGGTGYFLVVLGQYGAVLVGTWWYWVSIGWYWLRYNVTGSLWSGKDPKIIG